jgi:hypothetical protein
MIVREKMAKREERLAAASKTQQESRNPSTKRSTKGKALPLAEENWNNQQTLNTRALDRSFKSAMSRSPLKHRVDFGDLDGTTPKASAKNILRGSQNRSLSKGRKSETPAG